MPAGGGGCQARNRAAVQFDYIFNFGDLRPDVRKIRPSALGGARPSGPRDGGPRLNTANGRHAGVRPPTDGIEVRYQCPACDAAFSPDARWVTVPDARSPRPCGYQLGCLADGESTEASAAASCPLAIVRPQRYDKGGSIGKSLVTEASIWGPCESGSKHIQTPFNPLQPGRTSD